jgi:UPF0716 protein FxsA
VWLLVVAFVVVPLVEVAVLIQVGQVIGPWWTIVLLVLASIVGGWLVKREGGRAWRALQHALQRGRMPARELADGALILIGGTLLLTPGFVTDVVGLFVVLPFTRPLARGALSQFVARRLVTPYAGPGGVSDGPFGPGRTSRPGPGPDREGPVVRGDVVDPGPEEGPDAGPRSGPA